MVFEGWVYAGIAGSDVYFGSTYDKRGYKYRWNRHRSDYNIWLNGNTKKRYTSSILLYINGIEPAYEVLETYERETLEELKEILKEREAHHIKTFPCINNDIPGRTQDEYNKTDMRLNHVKKYNAKTKLDRYKCECGINLRADGKKKHEKTIKHVNKLKKI